MSKEPESKYVERKDGELYIKGRRLNTWGYRTIYKKYGKSPEDLTDEEVEEYEDEVGGLFVVRQQVFICGNCHG